MYNVHNTKKNQVSQYVVGPKLTTLKCFSLHKNEQYAVATVEIKTTPFIVNWPLSKMCRLVYPLSPQHPSE